MYLKIHNHNVILKLIKKFILTINNTKKIQNLKRFLLRNININKNKTAYLMPYYSP